MITSIDADKKEIKETESKIRNLNKLKRNTPQNPLIMDLVHVSFL